MSSEIDKIMAEAIGWTNIVCLNDVDDYWGTPPGAKGDLIGRVKLPVYSTEDAAALEWIKAAAKCGFDIAINISTTGIVGIRFHKPVWGDIVTEGFGKHSKDCDDPIAAALTDAVVEEYTAPAVAFCTLVDFARRQ